MVLSFLKIFVGTVGIALVIVKLFYNSNFTRTPSSETVRIPQMVKGQSDFDPLETIRRDCGKLCDPSIKGTPGPYFDHIKVPVNCKALFENNYIDQGHGLHTAPREIPNRLLKDFTMNGRVNASTWYFNEVNLGTSGRPKFWSHSLIEKQRKQARSGTLHGTYGVSEVKALVDGLQNAPNLKNGRVLVIGSQNPWVEACALEAGAREVVTLEYGPIISKHKQVKTLLPMEFRKLYLNGTLGLFDAVVTFSSVEHSGLGRFGDALNPWGDIIAIARAWCVTRSGGSLTIGVMYNYEKDSLPFNAARIYGKIRYPYLTSNWIQHYRGHGIQRVHVFLRP